MTSAAISAAIVIAKTILEITQDLKQHSENLGRLSAYVSRVMSMLESLQGLVSQNRDKSKTLDLGLEMLIEALQRAHAWTEQCRSQGRLSKVFKHSRLLHEYSNVMNDIERALGAIPLGNAHVSVDTQKDVEELRRELGCSAQDAEKNYQEMMLQLQSMSAEGNAKMDELKSMIQMMLSGAGSGGGGAGAGGLDADGEVAALQRELMLMKEERQEMKAYMQSMLQAVQSQSQVSTSTSTSTPAAAVGPGLQRKATIKTYAGDHLRCPICKEVMLDPVTLTSTGINVDLHCMRARIQAGNCSCPTTHAPLTPSEMALPNRALREMAKELLDANPGPFQAKLVERTSFALEPLVRPAAAPAAPPSLASLSLFDLDPNPFPSAPAAAPAAAPAYPGAPAAYLPPAPSPSAYPSASPSGYPFSASSSERPTSLFGHATSATKYPTATPLGYDTFIDSIPTLITALRSPAPETRESAALQLAASARTDPQQLQSAAAPHVRDVLKALATTVMSGSTEPVKAAAAETLGRLVDGNAIALDLGVQREVRAVHALVVLISSAGTDPAREKGAFGLAKFAVNARAQDDIVSSNGLLWLVELLRTGTSPTKAHACGAIKELAKSTIHRPTVAQTGAPAALSLLLSDPQAARDASETMQILQSGAGLYRGGSTGMPDVFGTPAGAPPYGSSFAFPGLQQTTGPSASYSPAAGVSPGVFGAGVGPTPYSGVGYNAATPYGNGGYGGVGGEGSNVF